MGRTIHNIRRTHHKKISLAALVIGALLLLTPAYLYFTEPPEEIPPEPAFEGGVERQPPSYEAESEEKGESELPPLAQSDALLRESAAALSSHPDWANWLSPEQLIRRFVLFTDNAASGNLPRKSLNFLAPKTGFSAIRNGDALHLDPASYERYDAFADVIASIDIEAAAEIFRTFHPLLEEAFAELGYPDRSFDETLDDALEMIRSAPRIEGDIALVHPSAMYKFKDPKLEKLNRIHKQLIRMGPENTLKIQQAAGRFSAAVSRKKSRGTEP